MILDLYFIFIEVEIINNDVVDILGCVYKN